VNSIYTKRHCIDPGCECQTRIASQEPRSHGSFASQPSSRVPIGALKSSLARITPQSSSLVSDSPASPWTTSNSTTVPSNATLKSVTPGPSFLLPGTQFDLVTTTGGIKKEPYTTNASEKGLLYSKSLFFPQLPSSGLVLCCHGQIGSIPDDTAYQFIWEFLAKALAVNNFIVASIRHNNVGADKARDQFLEHVEFLLDEKDPVKNPAVKFNLQGRPVALIGQSEGGTGAIMAAIRISEFATSNVLTFVRAVVALAPSTSSNFQKTYTDALLTLQGTHDGDEPKGAGSLVAYEYALPAESKHFCWIHGANHIRMLDTKNAVDKFDKFPDDGNTSIKSSTQHLIVQNYVTAFLRWKMANATQFRPLFIGDGSFKFSSSADMDVISDIQKGLLRVSPRYDFSGFQSKQLTAPSKFVFTHFFQNGDEITVQKPAKFDSLRNLTTDLSLFHQETPGFLVEWDRSKLTKPSISIPVDAGVMLGNPKFIEFHAVLAHALSNPDHLSLPIFLWLQFPNQPPFLSSPVFVNIFSPLLMKSPSQPPGTTWTRYVPGTIRIPLANWKIPPGAKILMLVLNFGLSSALSGRIVLTGFRAVPT
jgi:hypothetical protein